MFTYGEYEAGKVKTETTDNTNHITFTYPYYYYGGGWTPPYIPWTPRCPSCGRCYHCGH